MSKQKESIVLGIHLCPICLKKHDSGETLIHKALRDIPKDKRLTGYSLCDEHKKTKEEGLMALIGADKSKSRVNPDGSIQFEGAHRTGQYMMVPGVLTTELFNGFEYTGQEFIFVDPEVLDWLMSLKPPTKH